MLNRLLNVPTTDLLARLGLRRPVVPASPPDPAPAPVSPADSPLHLTALLSLSASLLDANHEEEILRAAMSSGCEVLGAQGCVFLPFDEFAPSLPPLEFGRAPSLSSENWQTRLTAPSLRQTCKVCQARHSHGSACPMLHEDPQDLHIHCVSLPGGDGREAGLLSFVFPTSPRLSQFDEWYLKESMQLVERALASLKHRWQDHPATDAAVDSGAEIQSLIPQIEFRAVVGERARLAREIHDGLAQTLAFLKIEIGRAEKYLSLGKTEDASRILHDSSRTISDAYLDARQAIENLRRVPDGGLAMWLQQVADDFETLSGIPVETHLSIAVEISPNVQAQLIRIVQEALTNVRRHAQATHVRLYAQEREGEIFLEVEDDGLGFLPSETLSTARFGLRGMRERADAIGSEFQIASRPGQGTLVRVHVPVHVEVHR